MTQSYQHLKGLEFYFPSIARQGALEGHIRRIIAQGVNEVERGGLSWARLDQIMRSCSLPGMGEGFYRYYFLECPNSHPFPVHRVFDESFSLRSGMRSIELFQQLEWGIRRFFYDAMLFWGNFHQAYRALQQLPFDAIERLFREKRLDTGHLVSRGKVDRPEDIQPDRRYLISELACKAFGPATSVVELPHVSTILHTYRTLRTTLGHVTNEELLRKAEENASPEQRAALSLLYQYFDERDSSESNLLDLYKSQYADFKGVRSTAQMNTQTYLSLCNDLDSYVATSMRSPAEFEYVARICKSVFESDQLREYDLRYFDPTLSAADHHEDKGIIECLMVKTARMVLYLAQDRETLGKVSEYAMALSLGKPVIILCPETPQGQALYTMYRDAHPLTRLVEFRTGVVCGALITYKVDEVVELMRRIVCNEMEYDLTKKDGTSEYFLLKERMTESTYRVVTDNRLLTETFWNNYRGTV